MLASEAPSKFLGNAGAGRAAFGIGSRGGHITANSFDLFGETVQKVLPDGTLTETRNYDTAGNLTSLTHFNGVTTTYTYDSLNRLLSRATPGEATVSFTYTATGKYLTSTAGDGTVNYSYDSLVRKPGTDGTFPVLTSLTDSQTGAEGAPAIPKSCQPPPFPPCTYLHYFHRLPTAHPLPIISRHPLTFELSVHSRLAGSILSASPRTGLRISPLF